MTIVRIPDIGSIGVNKDISLHELPPNAWTDARNIRFLDGSAWCKFGYNEIYPTPSYVPQYVFPLNINNVRYWIYLTATKAFAVTNSGGTVVHTDLSHTTPRAGTVNNWSHTMLSGIPVVNLNNETKVPMYWDLNLANKFVDLPNWPASTYCKSIRSFNNFLVALGITKTSTKYPFLVKWSHPAVPGALPSSWDETDTTKDAGEYDLAFGGDSIMDGRQLRDSFMIYKEASCWRMDFVGGTYIFKFSKVLGTSGALNLNCIAELDGYHVVLTGSDIIVHDGQTAQSILNKQTRRYLFQNIDESYKHRCFVVKNPFFNEVLICYPELGATSCTKALVWNYVDKTVSFRDMPSLNHAEFGMLDAESAALWSGATESWGSVLPSWNGPEFTPLTVRIIMAGAGQKLFLLDSSAAADTEVQSGYLSRQGLSFQAPENIKFVRRVRPRIEGSVGDTVLISVGSASDPYLEPDWGTPIPFTIGSHVGINCLVSGRYIAIKFESGTAQQWRLDSYDLDIDIAGVW